MKKVINNPNVVVEEMLQGIGIVNPNVLYDRGGVVITHKEKSDRAGPAPGGSSSHEPAYTGHVGYDMLDAVVSGNVFAPSSPDRVLHGTQLAGSGHGALLIIKNYAGSIINFEIAEEFADMEGTEVDHVIMRDDAAAAGSDESTGRCGIAGTVSAHRLTGAEAEIEASFTGTKCVAEKMIGNVRSPGASLLACTTPVAGTYDFMIEEDCMEVGMDTHGEAGIRKTKLKSSRGIADITANKTPVDKDCGHSEVVVMINGLGTTPLVELYTLASDVYIRLYAEGLKSVKYYVGSCMTAIRMAEASYNILQLGEELKRLLECPGNASIFKEIEQWDFNYGQRILSAIPRKPAR